MSGMTKALLLFALLGGPAICQELAKSTPPSVLSKVDPAYTEEARAAKIEGTVVLSVLVGKDGVARDVQVDQGLDPGLDANAIIAVQQWRFQPGTRYGEAVDVKAKIQVNFRLLKKSGA
jgi:TonB family protein